MRVILTIIAFISFYFSSFSQTFNGGGGNIPALATTQTCFNANVTGIGVTNATNGLVSVCVNITHADVGDLEMVLRAPDGTVIPLTLQNGGNGNNFTNTCFTATAANPIKTGTAPFNGNFRPEGWLGAANNGQNANGIWNLCILDRRNNSGTGTVNSWSLNFGTAAAPIPPALPACANTLPSSSSCATATLVCDFNGQCGSTAAPSVQTWAALTAASCFSLQNNSFIRFIAAATTASFSVWIPTTIRPNYLDGGLQMLFFSGNCNGPVITYGCYEHIYPYSGTGQPTIAVISASGLTPGNTYYLMIDGYNGDNCTFTIAANTGVNVLNVTPAAPAICAGSSVNLTASGGNGVYAWSPAG
ncbi:MAG: proprotein convertase P-domain-containing protein, partial [Rhizobacter sp.]|nr:proprotein convertase P-domain-containing protein [Ferruginibacter sp.]